jgi:hypothetical protein
MKTNCCLNANIAIDPEDLKHYNSREQLKDLILRIDHSVAEVDFTLDLIITLIRDCEDDLRHEGIWTPFEKLLTEVENDKTNQNQCE